jgi:hypothetical protein
MWVKSSARVYVFRIESSNILTKDVELETDIHVYYIIIILLERSKYTPDDYRLPISPDRVLILQKGFLFV